MAAKVRSTTAVLGAWAGGQAIAAIHQDVAQKPDLRHRITERK
jgi:hypothetical protein